ncbi:MAG: glutamate-1-semialdehyde 2,1-aminomutase [Flavobacteriales bacterium]|nr:glutamate-1-semialdehyde 2,1-aminomutase [Flavobacteriales bacterium]MCB9197617.1 glutamate-1-semialdehyde 2,1-aminomutase [Flavobacteriales bacterium]
MNLHRSKELYERSLKHLVGGVNSPVRAFNSVGGNPLFISHAKGANIYDVDGNEYIDYVLSYGPMIIGHVHPHVQETVVRTLEKGYSFGATAELEVILAEKVCEAFSGMDKVRFVNSGTEAVMSAIRLARAYTGKNKIIKFSGCYHGHHDALLVAAGSGLATLSMPGSDGVTEGSVQNTLVAEYNDLGSIERLISEHKDIAAIFLEPIAGNMGVVLPTEEFITGLNKIGKENGILIVADEVMTGFRSCFGGAQKLLGLHADITCLGKVVGGGFPVGAYGAREEIMNCVAPLGNMYQAGTLSGNPVAMAGGIATLEVLEKEDPYQFFEKYANAMKDGMLSLAKEKGVALQVNHFGSMINPFFSEKEINNYEDAKTSDTKKFADFFWKLLEGGLYIPPSQFEAWFLNTKLDDATLNKTLEVFGKAI